MELNTPNSLYERYPSQKDYLDYTVKLVRLSPYPWTAGGIEAAQYAATFQITGG